MYNGVSDQIKMVINLIRPLFRIRRRRTIQSSYIPLATSHSASEKQSLVLGDDASPSELKTRSDQVPEKEQQDGGEEEQMDDDELDDCAAHSNHIKHFSGKLNADDLYALPNKRKLMHASNGDGSGCDGLALEDGGGIAGGGADKVHESTSADEDDADNEEKGKLEEVEDKDASKDLPPGWEKHEGEYIE